MGFKIFENRLFSLAIKVINKDNGYKTNFI